MKCALITDEQIKAIEDALSVVEGSLIARGVLDILKSLKVSEPVAWKGKTYNRLRHKDWGNDIPLYAGEQP